MKKIISRILLWGIPVVLLLVVIDILTAAGTFKSIEPHFSGTVRKINLPVAGPEDITFDQSSGLAFIAADDRRANFTNPGSVEGAIFLLDLADSSYTIRNITPEGTTDFHPHGISLWKSGEGKTYLFVISHRKLKPADVVERFEWRSDSLVHLESIEDAELMTAPNDLVAVGEREFYVSNDHLYAQPGPGRIGEEFLQRAISFVNHYDGQRFRTVAEGIAYANGVNVSPDGRNLYVASTTGRVVITYERLPDGSLKEVKRTDLETGVDNIDVTPDGDLWIGCHPQLLKYTAHARDSSNRSPSQVIRMKRDGTVEEVFLNNGITYSGSTVGAIYGKVMLIGSVFEPSVLVCLMD